MGEHFERERAELRLGRVRRARARLGQRGQQQGDAGRLELGNERGEPVGDRIPVAVVPEER